MVNKYFVASIMALMVFVGITSASDLPVTSDLLVHLNAQNVVAEGEGVSEMTDLSGNGNNAIQTDTAQMPILVSGGADSGVIAYDAIDFNDSKAMVVPACEDFNQDGFTWFVVYKVLNGEPRGSILAAGYEMEGFSVKEYVWGSFHLDYAMRAHSRDASGDFVGARSVAYDGMYGWNLIVGRWEDTVDGDPNSGLVDGFLNPLSNRKPTLDDARISDEKATGPVGLVGNWGIGIGANLVAESSSVYTFSNYFNGLIAEVVIYDRDLNDVEIEAIANHFKQKYNYGENDGGGMVAMEPLDTCLAVKASGISERAKAADIDEDCDVDFGDHAEFAKEWMVDYTIEEVNVPRLIAMFDGSSVDVTESNEVTSWINQATVGDVQDAMGDDGYLPVLVQEVMPNGTTHGVVSFDSASEQCLTIGPSSSLETNHITWFIVLNRASDTGTQIQLRSAYTDYSMFWGSYSSSDSQKNHARNSLFNIKSVSASDMLLNQWQIVTGRWDGDNVYMWLDGDESYYGPVTGAIGVPEVHVLTRIGADSVASQRNFFSGMMAEVRIYYGALSDTEINLVHAELIDKYIEP